MAEVKPLTSINNSPQTERAWFFFTIVYLIVDYGRPQDIILFLRAIKPGLICNAILIMFLIRNIQVGVIKSNCKQIKLIWLFIALLALYIPFAVNNFFAYLAFKDMILFMPFILSTIVCVRSVQRLKTIVFTCVCLMLYVAAYSLLNRGVGSGNYFQDENDLSLFVNMWIPFCYFLFISEKKIKKVFYGLGLVIGLAAVVVTSSRGGFVGLLAVCLVTWFFTNNKILSTAIILIAGLLLLYLAGDAYWAEMRSTTQINEGTAIARLKSWEAGWNMFLSNPLGVGGNNFQVRFPEYQPDYFERGMWGRVAHSLWFTLIPELGVFGIFLYGYLLCRNIRDLLYIKSETFGEDIRFRYLSSISRACLAGLAGFFVSGSFISVLYYPHYWYMTGLIVVTKNIHESMTVARSGMLYRDTNANQSKC